MEPIDTSELFSVKGMVVVITGGGTGIGLMMTQAFAQNGAAKVYITGRRQDKLDEAAKLHPSIIPIVGDVTSKPSLLAVADRVRSETGHIDLLCCNSGYMPPPIATPSSANTSLADFAAAALAQKPEDWNTTFATNSTAVFFTSMAFLTLLAASPRGSPHILITSSIAGYLRVPANLGAYPASKAATTHLTKHLSGALAPYGVRVNAIAPGLFPSELAAGLIAKTPTADGRDPGEEGAYARSMIPAQRLGRAEDVVGTVLYMASKAGAYLNGTINVLDGGRIGVLNGTY